MAEDSPIKFKQPSKKSRRTENCNLCVIYQAYSQEKLRNPGDQGIKTFIAFIEERRTAGDDDLYDRLSHYIDWEKGSLASTFKANLRWHKSCYSTFTSKKSLAVLKKRGSFSSASIEQGESSQSSLTPTTRSTADIEIDWENVCFVNR